MKECRKARSRVGLGIFRDPFQPQCVYNPLEEFILNLTSSCLPTPDFTVEYIQRGGLRDPLIFKSSDGLGIK